MVDTVNLNKLTKLKVKFIAAMKVYELDNNFENLIKLMKAEDAYMLYIEMHD